MAILHKRATKQETKARLGEDGMHIGGIEMARGQRRLGTSDRQLSNVIAELKKGTGREQFKKQKRTSPKLSYKIKV